MLDIIAHKLLLVLYGLLHLSNLPANFGSQWEVRNDWVPTSSGYYFEAVSRNIKQICGSNKTGYVRFPTIQLGMYQIFADSKLIYKTGDLEKKLVDSFFGAPIVACSEFQNSKLITFKVYSYTKHFANIRTSPVTSISRPLYNIFGETLNIIAAGALYLLAIFNLVVFWGRVPKVMTFSVALASILVGTFFLCSTSSFFGIYSNVAHLHRIANFCLWIGLFFFFKIFAVFNVLNKNLLKVVNINIALGIIFIIFGKDGDTVQFGIMLPFLVTIVLFFNGVIKLLRQIKLGNKRAPILQILSFIIFFLGGTNDILVTIGVYDAPMLFALAYVSGILFLNFSVNETIVETYKERDHLRENLEKEVKIQIAEIESRRRESEENFSKLKVAQAELIQSAKLASLGTLAAGIAHEINNSINYVNASLRPLDRLINDLPDEDRKAKIKKLMNVMKDGTDWTVKIVKSLRLYTGLNQAEFKEIKVREIVDAVLNMLNSRTRGKVQVVVNVPDGLSIFCSIVGVNQILMNLITNALDAMNEVGTLSISAYENDSNVIINVQDTGSGMSADVRNKIFDPFFTTKKVGSGTGLGLHIVVQEIKRHNGNISVKSELNIGTVFTVEIPKKTITCKPFHEKIG